jgi:hypothetical protein
LGHRKGKRKRERDVVERALGVGLGDDEDFPFEEWDQAVVFGVCPCCNSALEKYVDGFGCPNGCVFVRFS